MRMCSSFVLYIHLYLENDGLVADRICAWTHACTLHKEFEDLKNDSNVRYPEKHMLRCLKRKECFQGCFSKWSKQRKIQQWDKFAELCPEESKTHAEVTNAFRQALQMNVSKWTGSRFGMNDGLHRVPDPLMIAIDHVIMDVLATGQEVTLTYVQNVMNDMVDLWNDCTSQMRTELQNAIEAHKGEEANATNAVDVLENMMKIVQPCNISKHPKALEYLGQCGLVLNVF